MSAGASISNPGASRQGAKKTAPSAIPLVVSVPWSGGEICVRAWIDADFDCRRVEGVIVSGFARPLRQALADSVELINSYCRLGWTCRELNHVNDTLGYLDVPSSAVVSAVLARVDGSRVALGQAFRAARGEQIWPSPGRGGGDG